MTEAKRKQNCSTIISIIIIPFLLSLKPSGAVKGFRSGTHEHFFFLAAEVFFYYTHLNLEH